MRASRKDRAFHKAGERFGSDALYEIYAQRIEAFGRDPPPPNWDGVYEAESK
jgi:hypothetical protein